MNGLLDWLGISQEQASSMFYGLVGWSASAVTIRPRGLIEALVSLIVAVILAEAGADAMSGLIAKLTGSSADDWTKVSAILVGFGGIGLLQKALNKISDKGGANA